MLMFAAYNGHNNIVSYLLDIGADPNIQDNEVSILQIILYIVDYLSTLLCKK